MATEFAWHWGMRVSKGRVEAMAFALIELMIRQAPQEEFDDIVRQMYGADAPHDDPEALERLRSAGSTVQQQAQRHQHREAGLSALVDTARDLAAHTDLDVLLKATTRRARLLLGADMSYISVPDPETGGVHIRTADGHTSMLSVGLVLPAHAGLGNQVMAAGAPFWTADYLNDPKITHSPAIDAVVRSENLRAIIAVPLSHNTKPFGALYVGDRRERHYTSDEIAMLSSLGDLAGVAVDKATLISELTASLSSAHTAATDTRGRLDRATERSLLHKDLIELALGGCDAGTLAAETCRRLGGGVKLLAPDGSVLASAGDPLPEHEMSGTAALDAHTSSTPLLFGETTWVAPVRSGTEFLGTLLLRPGAALDETFDIAPEAVAQAFAAFFLLRRGTPQVLAEQASDELLDELLIGGLRPPQQQRQRALRLGVDLGEPHVLVIARPEENSQQRIAAWSVQYARRTGGLKTVQQGRAVLLLPGSDPTAAANTVLEQLTPALGHPVTVTAAGPVQDAASVSHAFKEALRCLDAMTAMGAVGGAASAPDLGFIGVLLGDNHDAEGFITATIGPVIDYDEQRLTELTRTLKAYYDAGASPSQAAHRLHVHPNTVGRRLERITALLGPDWQQPRRALEIQLALRLSEIRTVLRYERRSTPDEGREVHREDPTGNSSSGSVPLRRERPRQG